MTVFAKHAIATYYALAPRQAYWVGCSAGGRQGLKEAQQFPDDYDGIVAGSPGLDWTGRAAQAIRILHALEDNPAARLLQPQRELLHQSVVQACDAADGVVDGLIDDPRRCAFDPGVLECRDGASASCLTRAQVDTARLSYSSAVNVKTGRSTAGLMPGSELGWTDLGWTASARATGLDQFRFIVLGDPAWTAARFDVAADIVRADDRDRGIVNALDTHLRPFFASGGKLIQYHGWADPQISPANSSAYYDAVVAALGPTVQVADSYRLFLAPGMGHCRGGEGPSDFDELAALEQWVEQGQAPDRIVASHAIGGAVDRTRPLCPYPQVAVYSGTGSTDDAANFVCRAR
jgi:feruloyl esterase